MNQMHQPRILYKLFVGDDCYHWLLNDRIYFMWHKIALNRSFFRDIFSKGPCCSLQWSGNCVTMTHSNQFNRNVNRQLCTEDPLVQTLPDQSQWLWWEAIASLYCLSLSEEVSVIKGRSIP
jgi:hypothetical protein